MKNIGESDFGNLYTYIVDEPCNAGYKRLSVVSGFASSAVVRQVLQTYPDVQLRLIIGMAGGSGISNADHKTYCDLVTRSPERAECLYYVGKPLVHAKFYIWQGVNLPDFGIISSANFSWSGLGGYYEAGVYTNPLPLQEKYGHLREKAVSVLSSEVGRYVKIFTAAPRTAAETSASHGASHPEPAGAADRVSLSLLTAEGQMHTVSGLNWGQREGREPNQAYIPVPAAVHQQHPGFFPPHGRRFIVQTDDGVTLTCVIAQAGDKAIETPDDNSALGLYFRRRIGVPVGEFVTREILMQYGRTDVEFTKIDNDLFLMDFSRPGTHPAN